MSLLTVTREELDNLIDLKRYLDAITDVSTFPLIAVINKLEKQVELVNEWEKYFKQLEERRYDEVGGAPTTEVTIEFDDEEAAMAAASDRLHPRVIEECKIVKERIDQLSKTISEDPSEDGAEAIDALDVASSELQNLIEDAEGEE